MKGRGRAAERQRLDRCVFTDRMEEVARQTGIRSTTRRRAVPAFDACMPRHGVAR
jgi:hypothetical protein